MQKFLRRANTKLSVGWAAALLSGMSFVTMFLSLFRERLLNAHPTFGEGTLQLEAYRVAFKVPDFMFIVLVSGALSVTFIPILNERLSKGNKKSAWELTSSLINFLAAITAVASMVIIIFADPIVKYLLSPGLPPEGQQLAALLMRIIAINPFLFAISAVLTSVQQAVGRFFFFTLAPAIYSIGIIFGIVVLSPSLGIVGVAYGVVLGSLAQLSVGAIGMVGLGFDYTQAINWRHHGFRETLRLLPQRSIDQGIDYFNNLVEISVASRLKVVGLINAWEVAFTLHWVPINLIGVAISTAAFPQMTERLNQGRPDLFRKEFVAILRVLVWLALPTVVVAFLGRGYLVRLLIAQGNATIATLLGLLVVAMFFRAMFHLVSRSFYAQKDTRTPLIVSMYAIGLNVILAIYLVLPLGADLGINGLAIAQSVVAVIEVVILLAIMHRRHDGLFTFDLIGVFVRMATATLASGLVMYGMLALFPLRASDVGFFTIVPKFGLIVSTTLASYVLFSYVLRLKETKPVVNRLVGILFKPIKIS